MQRLLLMVRKDLTRRRRAPLAVILVLAVPLIFAGLITLSFGFGDGEFPKVELLIEDCDQSLVSELLVSAFGNEQMAQYFAVRMVGEEGRELMEKGKASALVRIPENFGEDLIKGEPTALELVRNPAQAIMPEIAEQTLTVLTDVLSSGARLFREPLDQLVPCLETEDCELTENEVISMTSGIYRTLQRSEGVLLPPAIVLETAEVGAEEEEPAGSSVGMIFLLVFPGVSVWALFMLGDMTMRDILTESAAGTLRRQLTCPIHASELVVSKALSTALFSVISLIVLSAIGGLAAGGGIDLAGFALLSLAVVVAVTGFASAVYGVARNETQGATFSSIVLLVFAFMGGSFVPINAMPATVRQFSPLSPFYWGTTGFQELIRGSGLADILPNAGVLVAIGAALLALGSALLGRKIRRGVAA